MDERMAGAHATAIAVAAARTTRTAEGRFIMARVLQEPCSRFATSAQRAGEQGVMMRLETGSSHGSRLEALDQAQASGRLRARLAAMSREP